MKNCENIEESGSRRGEYVCNCNSGAVVRIAPMKQGRRTVAWMMTDLRLNKFLGIADTLEECYTLLAYVSN